MDDVVLKPKRVATSDGRSPRVSALRTARLRYQRPSCAGEHPVAAAHRRSSVRSDIRTPTRMACRDDGPAGSNRRSRIRETVVAEHRGRVVAEHRRDDEPGEGLLLRAVPSPAVEVPDVAQREADVGRGRTGWAGARDGRECEDLVDERAERCGADEDTGQREECLVRERVRLRDAGRAGALGARADRDRRVPFDEGGGAGVDDRDVLSVPDPHGAGPRRHPEVGARRFDVERPRLVVGPDLGARPDLEPDGVDQCSERISHPTSVIHGQDAWAWIGWPVEEGG